MPELVLILVIAGVVMGPERIAQIARWLGKTTAQMQSISRQFMHQLNQEIDGVDDGGALRDAMSEMQRLRAELTSLKAEFNATTESMEAMPQQLNGGTAESQPLETLPQPQFDGLPNILSVAEDPE